MAFDRSFCSAQWEQIMIAARHWVKKKYLRQGLKLIRLFGQQVSRTTRVVIPAINPPHYWVSLVSSRHFQITDHHPAVSIHYRFTAGLRELKGRFRNKWFFFGGGGGGLDLYLTICTKWLSGVYFLLAHPISLIRGEEFWRYITRKQRRNVRRLLGRVALRGEVFRTRPLTTRWEPCGAASWHFQNLMTWMSSWVFLGVQHVRNASRRVWERWRERTGLAK